MNVGRRLRVMRQEGKVRAGGKGGKGEGKNTGERWERRGHAVVPDTHLERDIRFVWLIVIFGELVQLYFEA